MVHELDGSYQLLLTHTGTRADTHAHVQTHTHSCRHTRTSADTHAHVQTQAQI